ncbi:MAG: enoyl-CoA hydratase/isomerase family protein [Propionibacteriaceae bacterium]|nr:enoyl-CoA hydratase/isomerase family protein [Propionibacteriaceae bacterium]
MSQIDVRVENRLGMILLNRPEAINALSSSMIDRLTEVLEDWAVDDRIDEVIISGAGRGFCAGADVRELRQMILDGTGDPNDYLAREYRLDHLIATYPKPYTAQMHGIVMGGGMGISIHGSRRVVAPTTKLAMPETIIGLWPDVGVCYHLAGLPDEVGTYMALSGLTITGRDALGMNLADFIVDEKPDPVQEAPLARGYAFGSMRRKTDDGVTVVESPFAWMSEAFAGNDIAEILDNLESSDLEEAQRTAREIRARSPLSVVVTLEALRRAATMTLEEVFAQDLHLGAFFTVQPDFLEGVRAQLVDKDFSPKWTHSRIEEVTRVEVLAAFGE